MRSAQDKRRAFCNMGLTGREKNKPGGGDVMTQNTRVWEQMVAGCGENLSSALGKVRGDPKGVVNTVLRELEEEEIPLAIDWPKKNVYSVEPAREEELALIPARRTREAEELVGGSWLEPGWKSS